MTRYTIAQKKYLSAAQLFHWATKEHFAIWFTGSADRHRRTEAILPRLVNKGQLFSAKFGKRLVYACPRRVRNPDHILKIEHGLGCTEGLIRFWWSRMDCEIVQERYFYGCGSIPEWGLLYPNGKMLLYEFSTENDFNYNNKIKNKLAAYRKYMEQINRKFKTDSLLVFVLDVPREKVIKFVDKVKPTGLPVFFVDYETFKSVPIGNQFSALIYIWGEDGSTYPLSQNVRP